MSLTLLRYHDAVVVLANFVLWNLRCSSTAKPAGVFTAFTVFRFLDGLVVPYYSGDYRPGVHLAGQTGHMLELALLYGQQCLD